MHCHSTCYDHEVFIESRILSSQDKQLSGCSCLPQNKEAKDSSLDNELIVIF